MPLVAGYDQHFTAKSGITKSGGSVTGWVDQVTGTRELTVPTGQTSPTTDAENLNGTPIISFDGAANGNALQLADGSGQRRPGFDNWFAGYYVLRFGTASGSNYFVDAASASDRVAIRYNGTTISVRNGGDDWGVDVSGNEETWIVLTVVQFIAAGQTSSMYIDGSLVGTGTSNTSSGTGLTVGASGSLLDEGEFDIVEIVEYLDINDEPTQTEIDQNVAHLQSEWGLGGSTYTLTAEQGSYSLTGQSTGLLRTLRLISQQGSYAYTGQTTNLLKTYLLAAEQGSYSIVGADSELLETFILEAESGNYTLTGQETQFLRTLKLIADQGNYSLSGQTTNLLRNLLLTAEQGSYSLSGQDAIISAVSNYILNAESGSYSLTGNDTAFLRSLILEAGSGNYTLSGQQTQLLRKLLLSAASGTYTLTGEDIALTVEDSPEILILMSAIVSSLEIDSTITTELDLDSSV